MLESVLLIIPCHRNRLSGTCRRSKKRTACGRLKGGDPFVWKSGEELELLHKEGIPYEVVPGVTSPIAVPAYNGIPVTHRDFCSSLHIITGHKKKGRHL